MRTTLVIDDAVLRRAKTLAARTGTTLSAVVETALREALRERPAVQDAPFRLPTFGPPAGRRRKGRAAHSPAELYAAIEEDDVRQFER